jgi:NAD(P)-dependent dehydrogenase (short-subunit alcohol dehydrogenase family)
MSTKAKTVLVTGATTGIGKHVALDLARRGHLVFATGRNGKALGALEAEAASQGAAMEVVALDVTDARSIDAAAAHVKALTGGRGVDVLVNNAGYGQGGPALELTDETLRKQFDTNVFGLMAVTRAFAPDMIARGEGWIVNVSSIGGRITFPFFGAYHASKYALEALSDALRVELAGFGVRVVLIEPGPIASEFAERAFTSLPQGGAEVRYASSYGLVDTIRTTSDQIAFGPEHVAKAVRRAMGSRPRARYMAPSFLGAVFAMLPFVPTRLLDTVFRWTFGLAKKSAPAITAPAPGAALTR